MIQPPRFPRAVPIPLTTSMGFSPRLGPDYLLYVSETCHGRQHLEGRQRGWHAIVERGDEAQVVGGPAISPDGRHVAFTVRQRGQALHVMQADGTNARIVADSLDLRGSPAWAPDGQSITSAAEDHGVPHLYRVTLDGRAPLLLLSMNTRWIRRGRPMAGCCLLRARYRYHVLPEGGDQGSRNASSASAYPDAWSPAPGIPARRKGASAFARRHST